MKKVKEDILAIEVIRAYALSTRVYDFSELDNVHKKVVAQMMQVAVEGLGINWIADEFVRHSPMSGYRSVDRFEDEFSRNSHQEHRKKLTKEAEGFIEKFIEENK